MKISNQFYKRYLENRIENWKFFGSVNKLKSFQIILNIRNRVKWLALRIKVILIEKYIQNMVLVFRFLPRIGELI